MGVGLASSGKVIVSHPTGNANVTAVVNALYEHDLLAAFYTCLVWRADRALARFTPRRIRALLERRSRVQLPAELVRMRPARELVRSLMVHTRRTHLIDNEDNPFSIESIYSDLDAYVGRRLKRFPGLSAVYAYEDGAIHHFERARAMGIRCIYDLPIGYWRVNRQIQLEEAELQPGWKGTLGALEDSDAKLARKDREIALADVIFVASSYTRKTLESYPGWKSDTAKPVVVIPYGTPEPVAQERTLTDRSEPLRVLYVGSLSQRKGIAYLAAAMYLVGGAARLTVIGRKYGRSEELDRFCAEHRWIESLPHGQVLEEMSRHDVLVFPSLFEGFGLVLGEALSRGVPVITTPHTGGPDLVREAIDGFIVPIRDGEAIASRLMQLHDDRELLKRMSDAARERAGQMSWQAYQDKTAAAVRQYLS